VGINAAQALGKMGEKGIFQLAAALEHESKTVRWNGAYGLSKAGPEAKIALPALIRNLESKDQSGRYFAAVALGKIGPDAKEAVWALKKALKDEDESVRMEAKKALEAIRD
jgi:HEAT repeat protein